MYSERGCGFNADEKSEERAVDILHEKHSQPQDLNAGYVIESSNHETLCNHPFILDRSDVSVINRAAMKTHRSHGPLKSGDICNVNSKIAIGATTERLAFFDSYDLCRLIAPEKKHGV